MNQALKLARLEARVLAAMDANAKNQANVDYLAMMADIEIPEGDDRDESEI